MSETSAETVETVATRLAASGQSVTIWIEGDTGATPRQGNALCARVVALLKRETGATDVVYNPEESETIPHDHTVVYTMDPTVTDDDWWPVLAALAGGRTVQPNVVIHAVAVPRELKSLIDVRMTVPESGGIGPIVRHRTDDTSGSVIHEEEMAGFVGRTNPPRHSDRGSSKPTSDVSIEWVDRSDAECAYEQCERSLETIAHIHVDGSGEAFCSGSHARKAHRADT
ncbi:hypothetical protein [Halocatena marina]|uniref:hypothetical protein n=1 Tax=Halocatena marina TaxID=2934937 RepID=UPI00200E65FC|nr:hypothetical protein [Halocatena marina]